MPPMLKGVLVYPTKYEHLKNELIRRLSLSEKQPVR